MSAFIYFYFRGLEIEERYYKNLLQITWGSKLAAGVQFFVTEVEYSFFFFVAKHASAYFQPPVRPGRLTKSYRKLSLFATLGLTPYNTVRTKGKPQKV